MKKRDYVTGKDLTDKHGNKLLRYCPNRSNPVRKGLSIPDKYFSLTPSKYL